MAYIGSTPTSQNFTSGTDYFSGTGSQTAFTLTRTVNSVNDIEVVINNVVQQPSTAYTLSGTTITFTSAPSSGTNNIYVRYLATNMQSFTVPANSITRSQLDSNLQAGFQGRNRIINGNFVIDQRNAGASVTPATQQYTLDRWAQFLSQSSKLTIQQNAGSVTPPVGFTNYLGITSTSAYSINSTDFFNLYQFIEGYNVADLGWGTSNAKTVTLSFWVRSSLTGTFGGSLMNSANDRSYPFIYTISSANTWEQKSITIAGDTSGTWLTTNGVGLRVQLGLGLGSTLTGPAGAWAGAAYYGANGATSVVGTSGATFYITGVQLEEGTTATSFERETYSVTLQKCQRYYEVVIAINQIYYPIGTGFYLSGSDLRTVIAFKQTKRANPSLIATSGTDYYTFYRDGASDSFNSIFINDPSTYCTQLYNNSEVSGSSGQAGLLYSNSNSASIAFSAEL